MLTLVPDTKERRNWTLADEAAAINKEFDRLDSAEERRLTAEQTANYARRNIGGGLITARAMLKAEDPKASFEAWCRANIKRDIRDIYRLIKLAEAADPELAEREARARGSEQKTRDRKIQKQSAGRQPAEQLCEITLPEAPPPVQVTAPVHVEQPSKAIKTALKLYRKMTKGERQQFRQGMEEVDNDQAK